ncbi:hypothetical protein Zmor_013909 [Zophobas morio]|uniref:Uncharacterized protein n=1 Tax=Zophobas morio TaxID=2755281 RepID=A0AA38MG67_9CUCU|nr:hypothetical protein Zmor_013909 [Zophobas morio]
MDRYFQNTSSNAPGFVYFNQNTSQEAQNKSDTTDFLAFADSPQASPQPNRFTPPYYSSPQTKFYRGSPRNYPPHTRRYQRWSGGNRSFNSSGSSFNQSTSFRDDDQETEISKFVHPSFLEDPWGRLEAKLKEQSSVSEANDSRILEEEET